LAILHPIPTPAQLPQAGDWWSEQRKFVKRRSGLKRFRKPLQNFLFGEQKQRLIRQTRKVVPAGKLLDIGCGTGKLLKIARQWYDCEGVEPSERAANECRQNGFRVRSGFFEDVQLPPASYDIAIMDAVLEHVHDPVQVLRKVYEVLRPDGVIAVKVPKLDGPAHRVHGREWNGFRVGFHTYLFTGRTLTGVLNRAGFDVLNRPKRDRPLDDLLLLWGRKRPETGVDLLGRAA
jgi:SAM-dependent methyltransferase